MQRERAAQRRVALERRERIERGGDRQREFRRHQPRHAIVFVERHFTAETVLSVRPVNARITQRSGPNRDAIRAHGKLAGRCVARAAHLHSCIEQSGERSVAVRQPAHIAQRNLRRVNNQREAIARRHMRPYPYSCDTGVADDERIDCRHVRRADNGCRVQQLPARVRTRSEHGGQRRDQRVTGATCARFERELHAAVGARVNRDHTVAR